MAIRAGMAQLVEHFTRNEGVVGSSPISSLKVRPQDAYERVCVLWDFLYKECARGFEGMAHFALRLSCIILMPGS